MPHKDPDAGRAYRAARYQANREQVLAYQAAYRAANPESIRATKAARHLARKLQLLEWHGTAACSCGEDHPAVLDFHHRDPAEKSFTLASGERSKHSDAEIRTELDKCDVLCSNCHRKHHCNYQLEKESA